MKSLTKKLLLAIIVLSVMVVGALGLLLMKSGFGYKTEKDYIYYFNGYSKVIDKGTKIEEKNTIAKIDEINFKGIPLVSSEDIILTDRMVYYPINSFNVQKVEQLTIVSNESSLINFRRNAEEVKMQQGLLYNGEYVYILLADMELVFNDKIIELSSLSPVFYDGFIVSYYDFKTCQGNMEQLIKENVCLKTENMSVSLNEGIIEIGTENQLMFNDPSVLDSVFGD